MDTDTKTVTTALETAPRARLTRPRWLLVALPALLLGGTLASQAYAFPHGHGGTPEEHQAFVQKRVDRMLEKVKATDDQKTRIHAALDSARPQFQALRAERQKLHQQAAAALTADQVDPNTIEQLRQQGVKLADQSSAIMSRTLVQVANILTPAQRKEAMEHFRMHAPGAF